jgi:hypothetical protein
MNSMVSTFRLIQQSFFSEVDSDRRDKSRIEQSIGVLIEEARFTHTRVAQSKKFY